MTPMKLNLATFTYPYGGNGSMSSEHPDVRKWLLRNLNKIKAHPHIAEVREPVDISDTPITMTRNQSILQARALNADLLLMIDSDMAPDLYLGVDPEAEPFLPTAVDFIYKNWSSGPSAVAAPYCGPPPHENIYVFRWQNLETDTLIDDWSMSQYTRHEAANMAGIHEAAALPTGLILWDMRAFELTEPKKKGDEPWFSYQYRDHYQAEKVSTEDVVATRNISFAGIAKYGRNPLYCAWSSWAGHWKPKCVGKPRTVAADFVVGRIREAMELGLPEGVKLRNVDCDDSVKIDLSKAWREPNEPTEPIAASGFFDPPWSGFDPCGHEMAALDVQCLIELANKARRSDDQPAQIVEVGSFVGLSAAAIAANGLCQVACVDNWCGDGNPSDVVSQRLANDGEFYYSAFLRNTLPFPNIRHIRLPSVRAAKLFDDGSQDMVFIDAGHTYEDVAADIAAWLPKVREGGILCGHDYRCFPDVGRAVSEILGRHEVGGADVWWKRIEHNAVPALGDTNANNGSARRLRATRLPKARGAKRVRNA